MKPVTPGAAIQVHATAKSKPRIEITRYISLNRPTSLSLTPVKPFIKAPGQKCEVALQATYDNGATRPVSPSTLDRFFRVYRLQATPHGGSFKDGMFRIEEDPQRIVRHNVGVALRSTLFPELGTDLNVFLDYFDHYQFQVSGLNGTDGFGGSPGVIGAPGGFRSDPADGRRSLPKSKSYLRWHARRCCSIATWRISHGGELPGGVWFAVAIRSNAW